MKKKLPNKNPEVLFQRLANHFKITEEIFMEMNPRMAFLCLNKFYKKLFTQVSPEFHPVVVEQLIHMCDDLGFTLIRRAK